MSTTTLTTSHGKCIHLITSDADLCDPREQKLWVRAYCHIHGSDHQRSLVIRKDTGWGRCFQCQAIVLIEARNIRVATSLRRSAIALRQHQACLSPFQRPLKSGTYPSSSRVQDPTLLWQQRELGLLHRVYAALCDACFTGNDGDPLAQAYLVSRGISLELAQQMGVRYLSPSWLTWFTDPAERRLLARWINRLVIPLFSPAGRGYIGRSLWGWQEGMDEEKHKVVLCQPHAPRRWIKTHPAGWFGSKPSALPTRVILVEGVFDRLTLLEAGYHPHAVLALNGTACPAHWLPEQISTVILALDADPAGRSASQQLAVRFQERGKQVEVCPAPHEMGKDWNAGWVRHGDACLESLQATFFQSKRSAI